LVGDVVEVAAKKGKQSGNLCELDAVVYLKQLLSFENPPVIRG
jgi:hypothetical protein